MMKLIAKENKIPVAILDFIEGNTTPEMSIVDFRLLFKIHDFYQTNKRHWKDMARAVMKSDEELAIVRKIADSGISTKEQIDAFISATGKGRTTFFKRKRELGI